VSIDDAAKAAALDELERAEGAFVDAEYRWRQTPDIDNHRRVAFARAQLDLVLATRLEARR
jgi:hypothetical protein